MGLTVEKANLVRFEFIGFGERCKFGWLVILLYLI